MLHTRIWHAKLSPYYCTYLLFNLRLIKEQEQDSLQVIRLFIHEWDRRSDWLQTTAKHNVVWSIWAGDRGELCCAHLNREWQFHAKSHELIGAFSGCPPDWARSPPLPSNECSLPLPGNWTRYQTGGFSSADCWCFQVSNRCREIHLTAFMH